MQLVIIFCFEILESVRKSNKHKDNKIILCGNVIWRELSETLDAEFVDEFIWVDRKKFSGSIGYKYQVLANIYKRGFETVIESTYTREILFGDSIVKISNAKDRIGSSGAPDRHSRWKRTLLSDNYYTKLIPVKDENLFEFELNKKYFSNILDEGPDIQKPFIIKTNLPKLKKNNNNYLVLFPGASKKDKMWASKKFRAVSEFKLKNYQFDIVISGSEQERYLFEDYDK
jgi:ADP-heptose:LPS heptosyltransferase